MKNVLLSADGQISVYSVPDAVADRLQEHGMEFCCNWLRHSPDAAKYRIDRGSYVGLCYTERDFIEYLNRYICEEPAVLVRTFPGIFDADDLPEEYAGLPYFNF